MLFVSDVIIGRPFFTHSAHSYLLNIELKVPLNHSQSVSHPNYLT